MADLPPKKESAILSSQEQTLRLARSRGIDGMLTRNSDSTFEQRATFRLAAEQARLAEEQSMVVGERDLAKMTSAQLATLVEGEDLDIEPQGPQEKVPDYRVRVRDALKAKLAEQGE